MKKILYSVLLMIFVISFASSTVINIKTNLNQGIYLTPIKVIEGHIPIIEREFYVSDGNGDIIINLNLVENFDLIVEFNDTRKYKKIFRENFNFNEVVNIEIFKKNNIGIVDRFGNDAIKNFVITGYAVYEKNQEVIVPVSYGFIGLLLLLFFISVFSKKESTKLTVEEEESVNENKKEAKEIVENLEKEEEVDIVDKERKDSFTSITKDHNQRSREPSVEGENLKDTSTDTNVPQENFRSEGITQEEIDMIDEKVESHKNDRDFRIN